MIFPTKKKLAGEAWRALLAKECLRNYIERKHWLKYHFHSDKVRFLVEENSTWTLVCVDNVDFQSGDPHDAHSSSLSLSWELPFRLGLFKRVNRSGLLPESLLPSHPIRYLFAFSWNWGQCIAAIVNWKFTSNWKGWILSQLLLLLYYYIDSGVQTCGLDFHFNNEVQEQRVEVPQRQHTLEVRVRLLF